MVKFRCVCMRGSQAYLLHFGLILKLTISRTHAHAELDEDKEVTDAIKVSVDVLARHLEKGEMVYGRSSKSDHLQTFGLPY